MKENIKLILWGLSPAIFCSIGIPALSAFLSLLPNSEAAISILFIVVFNFGCISLLVVSKWATAFLKRFNPDSSQGMHIVVVIVMLYVNIQLGVGGCLMIEPLMGNTL